MARRCGARGGWCGTTHKAATRLGLQWALLMGARTAFPSAHAAFHDSPADGRASCCLPLRGCAAAECLRLWADRQARLQGCACCRESRMLAAARSPSPLDWDGGCVGLGWRGCARR